MEENVYEVSLGKLLVRVLRYWWALLLTVVVGIAIAVGYTRFFVTPMYTSAASLSVSGNVTSYQDVVLGHTFAKDGVDIIKSGLTLNMAAEKLNDPQHEYYTEANETAGSILPMISTYTSEGSRFFDVYVKSPDPEHARKVASAVIDSFCELLAQGNIIDGGKATIVDYPAKPESPSSPNIAANAVIGALAGLVLGVGALLIIGYSRDVLEGEDWLIEAYNEKIPLLATIPDAGTSSYGYSKYAKYAKRYKKYD